MNGRSGPADLWPESDSCITHSERGQCFGSASSGGTCPVLSSSHTEFQDWQSCRDRKRKRDARETPSQVSGGAAEESRRAPVATAAVGVDGDLADSRTIRTVFTHQAVGVRPVWRVFGHQGNSNCDLLQSLDGALDLMETKRENQILRCERI